MNETEFEIFDTVAIVLMVLPVHSPSFVRKHGRLYRFQSEPTIEREPPLPTSLSSKYWLLHYKEDKGPKPTVNT